MRIMMQRDVYHITTQTIQVLSFQVILMNSRRCVFVEPLDHWFWCEVRNNPVCRGSISCRSPPRYSVFGSSPLCHLPQIKNDSLDTVAIPKFASLYYTGMDGCLLQTWLKWTFALGCRYCLCNVGRESRKKPTLLHGKNGPWPHDFFASESEVAGSLLKLTFGKSWEITANWLTWWLHDDGKNLQFEAICIGLWWESFASRPLTCHGRAVFQGSRLCLPARSARRVVPWNQFDELQTCWYQVNLLIVYFFHEAKGYHS